ncbi:MAG: hypothetical protein FWH04_07440 [Oscillospiraceae bacterium]|nr:hypothetical protein [Oscillospiraceae bacterium]
MNEGTSALNLDISKKKAYSPPASRKGRENKNRQSPASERRYNKISLNKAAIFVVVIGLLLLIVHCCMQHSELSSGNQKMIKELSDLKKEESNLRNYAGQGVSLSEVEQYAITELGMVKPGAEQVLYVDLAGEEKAEIIGERGFWMSMGERLSSALVQDEAFWNNR